MRYKLFHSVYNGIDAFVLSYYRPKVIYLACVLVDPKSDRSQFGRCNPFFRKAADLNIDAMVEHGDQYPQARLGLMCNNGQGVKKN